MSDQLKAAIQPNSNQLNADDLIAGPRTINITGVRVSPGEQPVVISFEGDNGKPWKPSKGMTRVMVLLWGDDETKWAGRSLTLYRNADVKWAGVKVGGIQISHASHIGGDTTIAVTMSKGNKQQMLIRKLATASKLAPVSDPSPIDTKPAIATLRTAAAQGIDALVAAWKATPQDIRAAINPGGGCPDEYKAAAKAADDAKQQHNDEDVF